MSRLKTLDDVRSELARVYREARIGTIETNEAKSFAYILSQLSGLIQVTDLERRVKALEGPTNDPHPH